VNHMDMKTVRGVHQVSASELWIEVTLAYLILFIHARIVVREV
jgi:hypothetical protein